MTHTPDTPATLRQWFTEYALSFAEADGRLHAMQQLKLEHSLRVADLARDIATRLAWPAAEASAGEMAAILHDVGRFSQYAEFKTFEDRRSVNHAKRSLEIIDTTGVLAALPPAAQACIRDAVAFHNARHLPESLPPASLPHLKLVRDADKLDIFDLFDDAIRHDKFALYPEIALHVDLQGPPSPAVLASLRAQHQVGYADIVSLADMLLVQLTWLYDINYLPSCELILDRKVIGRLAAHLAPYPEVSDIVATVQAAFRVRTTA